MSTSIVYLKELTAAEVGNTKTHEIYIRFPNDFDYEKFFDGLIKENGSVLEACFTAHDVTDKGSDETVDLRFVFFHNSNKEKRIPGLAPYFAARNVEEGDIVRLERRKNDGESPVYFINLYKKGSFVLKPSSLYFECDNENNPFAIPGILKSKGKKTLQTIYYGAPGTGKSHTIQQMTNDDNSVRITFHPDSDYASFVGAYKPTMTEVPVFVPFGSTVTEAIDGQGNPVKEKKIQYEFIPQAFLTAYVEAWKRMAQGNKTESPAKDYYLVIEEINRGNCAQIFGDLFQLLDRNSDGFSSYSIKPDKDLQNFLATSKEGFADPEAFPDGSIPEKIRTGQQMLLPPNLHIWATMNTSDQSLFPIDSAFKRRWDWVYIPISQGVDKNTGNKLEWVVRAGGVDWDWWSFLEQINPVIYSSTQSEDKKLGFFFARATGGVITAEQFVGKVIFYIWNDVFKDFGLDRDEFKDHNAKNGENDRLTFDKFFMPDGSPNEDNVVMLMENLKVKKVTDKEEATEDTAETE